MWGLPAGRGGENPYAPGVLPDEPPRRRPAAGVSIRRRRADVDLPGRGARVILGSMGTPSPAADGAPPGTAASGEGPADRSVPSGRVLGSVLLWIVFGAILIFWTPVVLLVFLATAWWDRGRYYVGRTFRFMAAAVLIRLIRVWDIRRIGEMPSDRRGPYVIVCNHESFADLLLVGSLPMEMKWLSKAALGRIPFLGWMMRMAGDVLVDRGDPESRSEALEELGRWIERGASVIVFPEGTRSPTDELLPFRNGAFRLAVEAGAPVLPLAVAGTREAIRKGSIVFLPARPVLMVLEPVRVEGLGPEDVEELREEVRSRIAAARRRVRPGSPGGAEAGRRSPGSAEAGRRA